MTRHLDLACRDCGQLHRIFGDVPGRGSLRCRRCGAVLWRAALARLPDPRALALAAAVLLLLANTFPLFDISVLGDERSGLIANAAAALFAYGGGIAAVGALVAAIAVAIPTLNLALVLAALFCLGRRGDPRHRAAAKLWRAALRLRPWSMLDVFLLAAVVAYTRLAQLADISVGIGGYALAAFVVMQLIVDQILGRCRVWELIGDPAPCPPAPCPPVPCPTAPDAPWVLCLDCDLVVAACAQTGRVPRRCPRCGARLAVRRPGGVAITTAFSIAGLILYLPANLLPVLTITRFGRNTTYTIMGGVRDLAEAGLWPLALLVFIASIAVPALKLASLGWCLVAIRWRSGRLIRERTALYRFVKYIGRWSNIDVFAVAMVVALVQFRLITAVAPGPGIASFAAVVLMTMIATDAFDPRLMWDAAREVRR